MTIKTLLQSGASSFAAFLNRFAGENQRGDEIGLRTRPEDFWRSYAILPNPVDAELRQTILDVRRMDVEDPRCKKIHGRIAGDTVRGGLLLTNRGNSEVIKREWDSYSRALRLNYAGKLRSDARQFAIAGNLALQWVLDRDNRVIRGVSMPPETIVPQADQAGVVIDIKAAYKQINVMTGRVVATWPLYKLSMSRLDPNNYDDFGSMGRPFLDASRVHWQKLCMTEQDLVIRRRYRAPHRLVHVIEGASKAELAEYERKIEGKKREVVTDFYMNRKGAVSTIGGDSALGEITDVVHLLDTFFSGSPLPKDLAGYGGNTARDVLEDLKRSYYDDIDLMQDELAYCYDQGFRLHLLLRGINPEAEQYWVRFAERRTETETQAADRALKWQALRIPEAMVQEQILGLNPEEVLAARKQENERRREEGDPYPDGMGGDIAPAGERNRISITPGNGRKGESATDIALPAD